MHFYLNKMITLYFTKTIQRCTVVSLLLITGYRIRTIYYLYCYPQTCSICCPNIRDATHASFTKIVSQFIALWINWITPLIGFNLQRTTSLNEKIELIISSSSLDFYSHLTKAPLVEHLKKKFLIMLIPVNPDTEIK